MHVVFMKVGTLSCEVFTTVKIGILFVIITKRAMKTIHVATSAIF